MIPRYEGYSLESDIVLICNGNIYVPPNEEMRNLIFSEAHRVVYMDHTGVTEMKEDLKPLLFWKGMQNDIANYVARCIECKQMKDEHRNPTP
jgi:hypothetical protein